MVPRDIKTILKIGSLMTKSEGAFDDFCDQTILLTNGQISLIYY